MRCCKIIRDLVTGVIPSTPVEPPVTERCIFLSNSFTLTGIALIYEGGAGAYAYSSARTLSEALQVDYPYSGSSYFGSSYTFWIALPAGDTPPDNWEVEEDPIGNPGVRIPVTWNEQSCFTDTFCFEVVYTVPDPATWQPYYFSSTLGFSEYPATSAYDQPVLQDNTTVAVTTAFGANASAVIGVVGDQVTLTLSGIPLNAVEIISSPDLVVLQTDTLNLIDCP